MNENRIIPFIYDESPVRVIRDEHGEPWFVAKDVCLILKLVWKGSDDTGPLGSLDGDEKSIKEVSTPGGPQEMIIINEPGLYTLIFRSNKPNAKTFRRWVTHEVLPSLRKTGRYSLKDNDIDVASIVGTNQRSIKNTHRVKLMEISRSLGQMDEEGRRTVLLIYADLCGIVSQGAEKPKAIADEGVQRFLDERCSFESGTMTPKADLYQEYAHYAAAKGFEVVDRQLFFKWLYQYGPSSGVSQYCKRQEGTRVHSLKGIKLN